MVADSGWSVISFATDRENYGPGFGHAFDQAWVNVRYSALNKYTVGLSAFAVTGGCAITHDDSAHAWAITPTH